MPEFSDESTFQLAIQYKSHNGI